MLPLPGRFLRNVLIAEVTVLVSHSMLSSRLSCSLLLLSRPMVINLVTLLATPTTLSNIFCKKMSNIFLLIPVHPLVLQTPRLQRRHAGRDKVEPRLVQECLVCIAQLATGHHAVRGLRTVKSLN